MSPTSKEKRIFTFDIENEIKKMHNSKKIKPFYPIFNFITTSLLIAGCILLVIRYSFSSVPLVYTVKAPVNSEIEVIPFLILSILYVFFLFVVKGKFISNFLFKNKKETLELCYQIMSNDRVYFKEYEYKKKRIESVPEELIKERKIKITTEDREVVFTTKNGSMIGILEGCLFAIGIFIQSITFIGIVLAVRSYVSVSSHQNKEEGEFYIIGVLGSLLFTILATYVYLFLCYYFANINILEFISKTLPSFKGEIKMSN